MARRGGRRGRGSPVTIKVKTKFRLKEVRRAVEKEKEAWLFEMGGTVINFSKRSMRKAPAKPVGRYGEERVYKTGKRKGKKYHRKGQFSRPGTPPHRRFGPPNLTTQKFDVDTHRQDVKIGPILLAGKGSSRQSRTVPSVQEFGGRVTVRQKKKPRRGPYRQFSRQDFEGSVVRTYPARPFMYPALVNGVKWLRRRVRGSFARRYKAGA